LLPETLQAHSWHVNVATAQPAIAFILEKSSRNSNKKSAAAVKSQHCRQQR
jgi:hypothetical protein